MAYIYHVYFIVLIFVTERPIHSIPPPCSPLIECNVQHTVIYYQHICTIVGAKHIIRYYIVHFVTDLSFVIQVVHLPERKMQEWAYHWYATHIGWYIQQKNDLII